MAVDELHSQHRLGLGDAQVLDISKGENMLNTVRIKAWYIEHDVDGRVYLGPYFTEKEAKEHNFENIHGWGRIYIDIEEAILADD